MRSDRTVAAIVAVVVLVAAAPNLFAQDPAPQPPSATTITCELMDLYTDNVHIKLSWVDSRNEAYYVLFRTQDETRLPDPSVWIVVATIDADTIVYHDYTVQPYDPVTNPKGTYYYKIIAYNEGGETESNNCNETMPSVNVVRSSGNHSGYCYIDAADGEEGGYGPLALLLISLLTWGVARRVLRMHTEIPGIKEQTTPERVHGA